jgi:Phage integrase family
VAGGVPMSGLRPLDGRCAWLPFVEDAAAFLAEHAGVVGELGLEGQLFAGVAAGVVYPLAPGCECAQGLQVAVVVPPALLERGQGVGVAAVQADDRAPHDQLIVNLPASPFIEVDRPLFLVAMLTGLRKGELVALRWCDVDFAARRVRVRRNYTRGAFGTPKSRRSARAVPLATDAAMALEQLPARSAWAADDDLVFAHPATGGVLSKSNVSRRMSVALVAADLDERHRFHDLRHTSTLALPLPECR